MAIDFNKFKKVGSTHTTIVTKTNKKKLLESILNKSDKKVIKREFNLSK